MANFDNLERALREWVHKAVGRLSSGLGPEVSTDLRRWQRDSDGIFRERERPVRVWRHSELEALKELPSWQAVERALQDDDRLWAQVDQLVGTVEGSHRFEAQMAGRLVLPLPDELSDVEGAFARGYDDLDGFLAAREIETVVIWPLPGLTSSEFPIPLERDLELGIMSDEELAAVLNTEVLRLPYRGFPLLSPNEDKQACLRYRYRLPKVIGDPDHTQAAAQGEAMEARLNELRDTLEQGLALLFANPVAISGRASVQTEWRFLSGAVRFQQVPLSQAQRFRRMHLDEQAITELAQTWRQLRQPDLVRKHKALALALRRLGYQAHRERVEDELVDILIAAEALYLSDVGYEELGFRLALRAAALCDPQKLGLTRRNVFDLMKSAYGVRSKIVHGEVPKAMDLKVKRTQVSLTDFVQATEEVIRQGLREGLQRASDPKGKWPPDWDEMTLPN
jgi:Apea-like HEPN